MSDYRRLVWPAILGLLGSGAAKADLTSDLADLSARAEYGFYTADAAVISAARSDLERFAASEGRVSYYRALAAMRAGQVDAELGRPAGEALDDCSEWAEQAAEQEPSWADAWVLVGACATLAAADGRRYEAAVASARRLEPDNPRLALVEVWHALPDHGRLDAETADALITSLGAAVDLFAAASEGPETPAWGEAEALALLGSVYLERGQTRAARDVLERALLAAPGYVHAVELMNRIGR
jgi:tetratricopeptide (TPR) repeat protein